MTDKNETFMENPKHGVDECVAHTGQVFEPDCDFCAKERADMEALLDRVNLRARVRAEELSQRGMPMPPDVLRSIRIEVLIDYVFGHNDKARLAFEIDTGRRVIDNQRQAMDLLDSQPGLHVPKKNLHVVRGTKK